MSVEFWEPWEPKAGDRVQVRLNGECALRPVPGSYYATIGQVGHPPYEDGLTGTVTAYFGRRSGDYLAQQGHPVEVEYDLHCRPDLGDGRRARGGSYAVAEVLPLDDHAAAGRRTRAGQDGGEG